VRRDPRRRHPIRPILVGPDGISKKIAVPLLAPLSAMEPFCVVLKYRLPNCLKAGVDYYTATLSFEQARIQRYLAQLQFRHGRPEWVRVYERRASGETKLLKDLRPQNSEPDVREYEDKAVDVPARIAMIYVLSRPTINSESGLGHSEAPVDLVDV